jgi:UDP-glucose 4-epimerase
MAVLVTGGCGYIGSHFVHELVDAGESVVVIDDLSTGFRTAVPASVPVFIGNAGDQALASAVIEAHGVTAIVHFAASIVVPDSVRDPLGYYKNNTVNTRALIEVAVKNKIAQFIFSSTAAVYGNPATMPVAEDAPTQPMSPYGTSKLMSEIMLHDAAAAYGLKYVILRYFNVAGADPKQRTGQSTVGATHLIKIAVETALGSRAKMDVYGTDYPTPDGTCIRDYIHVSDLARAHSMALAYLRGGGRSVTANCGYGHGYSVLEVIDAVKRASGVSFAVRHAERRAGDPAAIVANAQRAKSLFHWTPQYDDLDTIVAHALAWERKLMQERNRGASMPASA